MIKPDAAKLVADNLLNIPPNQRARWLREVLAHTAAGIMVLEGEEAAAEACYRLSDAVVSRGGR